MTRIYVVTHGNKSCFGSGVSLQKYGKINSNCQFVRIITILKFIYKFSAKLAHEMALIYLEINWNSANLKYCNEYMTNYLCSIKRINMIVVVYPLLIFYYYYKLHTGCLLAFSTWTNSFISFSFIRLNK
jgi:hypothetical protein